MKDWSTVKCCICGKPLWNGKTIDIPEEMKPKYFGNNPAPLGNSEDDRCCDYYNNTLVIPARIKELFK